MAFRCRNRTSRTSTLPVGTIVKVVRPAPNLSRTRNAVSSGKSWRVPRGRIIFPGNFTVLERGFILVRPVGTTLPDGSILPSGSNLPGSAVLFNGALLPGGTDLPKKIRLAEGRSLPGGNKVPERTQEEKKESEDEAAAVEVMAEEEDEEGSA